MSLRLKKCASIILATMMAAMSLSGCSNTTIYYEYREVEKLELIRSLGVDLEDDEVSVTACNGLGLSGAKPKIIHKKAKSIAAALDIMQNNPSGREPIYSHTDHMIIGEDAANKGLAGYIDYVSRATEMRADTNLFVVKEGTAEKLLEETAGESTAASDMLQSLEMNLYKLGEGFMISCGELAANLARHGSSLVLAVKLVESDEADKESGGKMIVPAGFGIIKDGKLIDFLPEELAHSVCVVTGNKVTGNIIVKDRNEGRAVLSYNSIKSEIKPVFNNGKLESISIKIKCNLNIEELMNEMDLFEGETRKMLALQVAEREKREAEELIYISQKTGIDFLHIGEIIQLKEPVKFSGIEKEWEILFSNIKFEVSAEALLERTYDINDPINLYGNN